MTHVLLCRHGQTDANAAGIVQGHMPTSLNDLGRQQAEALAYRLAKYQPKVTRLITSPLLRALETAEVIAVSLDLPLHQDSDWTERHFGSGQGKPFDLLRIMTEGRLGHIDPEDAEPRDLFDGRVLRALARLPGGEVTAVVTHGGVIGSVTRGLMGGAISTRNPPKEKPSIPNCSILHLSREGEGPWTLECIADASHLTEHQTAVTAKDAG